MTEDLVPVAGYLRAVRQLLAGTAATGTGTRSCPAGCDDGWITDPAVTFDPDTLITCPTCNGAGEIYDPTADAPYTIITHHPPEPEP